MEQKVADVSEPWDSWDFGMFDISREKPVNCPEYDTLNSKDQMRKILKETRAKFLSMAEKKLPHVKGACVLLMGGREESFELYNTDTLTCPFRQEAFFRYLFGVNEPNFYGLIDLFNRKFILFIEPISIESERWLGQRRTFNHYKTEYMCDDVSVVSKISDYICGDDNKNNKFEYLYLLKGVNSDSGLETKTVPDLSKNGLNLEQKIKWIDYNLLHPLLSECRVLKTQSELEVLRAACKVTSQGHLYVMKHVSQATTERQLEALFKGFTYFFGGARHQAYTCICGSGRNGSILHYGHAGYPNDRPFKASDTVVLDMGSEYNGYATDITCSYPVSGKFTPKQRLVHTAVYEAQQAVMNAMKPGVLWTDMHLLAERTILLHLYQKMGILCVPNNKDAKDSKDSKDSKDASGSSEKLIDYFMELKLASLFMPHGLGHFVGLQVHDVGGFTEEYPSKRDELGLCWLRTTRRLEKGMFITVEPGLYFNEAWINQMLAKKENNLMLQCVNMKVLKEYFDEGIGGVRLEDDVLVTQDGMENFTLCPRTCEQIESVMASESKK